MPTFFIKIFKPIFLENELTTKGDFYDYNAIGVKFENIYLITKDNVKIGCWVLLPPRITKDTVYMIALHGVALNRADFIKTFEFDVLVRLNYVLLVPDYRSFGDSQGTFEVEPVNYDIDAVRHYCNLRFQKDPIYLGHSFGGAVALEYLRYSRHKNKIVLISTYTSTVAIANTYTIYNVLEKVIPNVNKQIMQQFGYNSIEHICLVKKEDVIVFHGTADAVIPFSEGMQLAEARFCEFVPMMNRDHFTVFYRGRIFYIIDNFVRKRQCINNVKPYLPEPN
ncbi:hypothetical protein COBT_002421 [Conglomerata obtusa]